MPRIWVLGEALIDFVPVSTGARTAYLPVCGGSPHNAAIAAALQEADVGFLSAISTDLFGDRLAESLSRAGVDISAAPRVAHHSTLAFVDFEGTEPRYAFFNSQSSTQLDDPDPGRFGGTSGDILHLGSIALIEQPVAGNIERFAEALSGRVMLSVDPNARPGMTPDKDDWRGRINRLIGKATIVKLSDEDLAELEPGVGPEDFARRLVAEGVGIVLVTLGDRGAIIQTRSGRAQAAVPPLDLVDTVGAGDTVTGSLLAQLLEQGCGSPGAIAALASDVLSQILARCMAAAALNCETQGCNPPTRTAVLARLGSG